MHNEIKIGILVSKIRKIHIISNISYFYNNLNNLKFNSI